MSQTFLILLDVPFKFFHLCLLKSVKYLEYEGESISNQPNFFPVEMHLFFLDVIAI